MIIDGKKYTVKSVSEVSEYTGVVIYELKGPRGGYYSLAVFPSGKAQILASGGKWQTVEKWTK